MPKKIREEREVNQKSQITNQKWLTGPQVDILPKVVQTYVEWLPETRKSASPCYKVRWTC
jgi:hypothetical protein